MVDKGPNIHVLLFQGRVRGIPYLLCGYQLVVSIHLRCKGEEAQNALPFSDDRQSYLTIYMFKHGGITVVNVDIDVVVLVYDDYHVIYNVFFIIQKKQQ